ncbi:uncharacterized protein LOC135360039 [Latimeria chalumnae]|uniref:uncharacterized protein LOC135360039 n=1 Tax=Latimeria chalumnae TaxID=7897 RepID=UPI00313C9A65
MSFPPSASDSERESEQRRVFWQSARSPADLADAGPLLQQASPPPSGSSISVPEDLGPPFVDPEALKHPRSSDWSPSIGVASFLKKHLRSHLSVKARQRLKAECPRPIIDGNVQVTPTVDQSFLTYFSSKLGKGPQKGLDRSLKGVQDKLLDISGPLTKILGIAEDAIAGHEVHPQQLLDWAQRAVWMLGNANAALSTERRRNFLIKISPHSTDLASKDFGPEARGLLFGDPFLKELSRSVKTFSSLDHAASSLRKSLAPQVFRRAGGYRGPPSGRAHIPPQQAPRGPTRGGFHRGTFRPRGSRPDSRGRGSAPART